MPLSRVKRFGVWAWEQPWDEKVFPLTMHFICFYSAGRKDAVLEELPAILDSSAANLKILASKLVKQTEKLDIRNSLMSKLHSVNGANLGSFHGTAYGMKDPL